MIYEPFSRFSRKDWIAQARSHLRAARTLIIFGHPNAGERQIQLAREARQRARLLLLANSLVLWAQAMQK